MLPEIRKPNFRPGSSTNTQCRDCGCLIPDACDNGINYGHDDNCKFAPYNAEGGSQPWHEPLPPGDFDVCTGTHSNEATMTAPVYTITNDSITVLIDGVPRVVAAGTPQYAGLAAALVEGRFGDLAQYLTQDGALQRYLGSDFRVEDGKIFDFTGAELPQGVADKIIAMAAGGEDPTPLLNFYRRLSLNPSRRSVQQLFSFLGHCGIPLEPDGTFLAYKGVREDFLDRHSGTLLNTPGTTQKMPRNQISDDPNTPCHEGLHVGALSYARSFAARTVVCRIDPANVVCVPYDYSCQKMRVCEYYVVGNYQATSDEDVLPSTSHEVDVPNKNCEDPDWGGEVEYEDEDFEPAPPVAEAPRPVRVVTPRAKQTGPKAASFNRKSPAKLMDESLADLRLYATHHLKIVGAGHIPGGKSKLVSAILKARRKRSRK